MKSATIEQAPASLEPRLSILMYHQVGRFAPMKSHRANYCDHRRFARQMDFLRLGGFRVLSLETALECLAGRQPMPARALVLTFDDGYAGFLDHVVPVLVAHGYPATVYAISDWLGKRMRWHDPDPARARPRLMKAQELRSLGRFGIAVGSHGRSHQRLAELEPAAQRSELADSRAALEDVLGAPIPDLCYPFGSFNDTTIELAAAAGYRSAMTCLRGAATPGDHPLVLPRKAISYGDNRLGYAWKLLFKHAPKPALQAWRDQRDLLPATRTEARS